MNRRLGLLVVLAGLALPRLAQAEVLVAVVERVEGAEPLYWWGAPESAPGPVEALLSELLAELGKHPLDRLALAPAPKLSRVVYGQAELTTSNGINLASLYGATRVILGEARQQATEPAPLLGWPGVRLELDLHVYATGSSIEILPLSLELTRYAPTVAEAESACRVAARERLALVFAQAHVLDEVSVGVNMAEPVLLLTGLSTAKPLVEVKKQLKTQAGVSDVIEAWAAEGVIAVELNPGVVDDPSFVMQAFDAALRASYERFSLQEVKREGQRVEAIVVPTAAP